MRKAWLAHSTWTISALTATCAEKLPRPISRAMTMVVTPMSLSSRRRRRKKSFARKQWKVVPWKRSGTTVPVQRERTTMMNLIYPAKPTRRTGEPEAPARASVPKCFRRLKWNEVVWQGDFVADKPWASTVGRAGRIPSRIVQQPSNRPKHCGKAHQNSGNQGRATWPGGCVHSRAPENRSLQCRGNL